MERLSAGAPPADWICRHGRLRRHPWRGCAKACASSQRSSTTRVDPTLGSASGQVIAGQGAAAESSAAATTSCSGTGGGAAAYAEAAYPWRATKRQKSAAQGRGAYAGSATVEFSFGTATGSSRPSFQYSALEPGRHRKSERSSSSRGSKPGCTSWGAGMAFPASTAGVRATSMVATAASSAAGWMEGADSGAQTIGDRGSCSSSRGRGG